MPLFLEQLNQNMSEYFQRSRSDEIIGSPVHNPLLPLSPRAVRARARRERNERRASVRNERRSRQSDESEATTVEDVSSLQSDEIDGSSEVMMEFVLDEESSEDLLGREREEEQGMGDEVGLVMQEDSDDEEKGATLRDPLTLDDLGMHVYEFKVANSSVCIKYNVSSLVHYYTTSGTLRDPVTGIALREIDLRQLDEAARLADIPLERPLYDLFNSTSWLDNYKQNKNREFQVLNLETLLGELVTVMLGAIENYSDDSEVEASIACSQFDSIFDQFKKLDLERSYQMLKSSESFLKGPTRKPTRINPLYNRIREFMSAQWKDDDEDALEEWRRSRTDAVAAINRRGRGYTV
jgi:hypothetical protein